MTFKRMQMILLLVLVLGFITGCQKGEKQGGGTEQKVETTEIRSELVVQGRQLFEAKCTACHQLDQRLVGPALRHVAGRRSPEWIEKMILNPDKMVKEDKVAKALYAEYGNVPMLNQGLSRDEARAIVAYFRDIHAQNPGN